MSWDFLTFTVYSFSFLMIFEHLKILVIQSLKKYLKDPEY